MSFKKKQQKKFHEVRIPREIFQKNLLTFDFLRILKILCGKNKQKNQNLQPVYKIPSGMA
jgi:hypothetical protein